jgi:hypothetical protein
MNKECTHREYYAQFVNQNIRALVARHFDIERLARHDVPYFNSPVTQLRDWDALSESTKRLLDTKLWRECESPHLDRGYLWSPNSNICILKEAAQQLVDEHRNHAIIQASTN